MTELERTVLSKHQLRALTDLVLQEAAHLGATEAEVSVAANKGFNVTARDGDVEKVEYNQDKVIDIGVYFGKRTGSASISDIRPQAVKSAVEAACHIAKFTHEDPAAGLAEKEELAFSYPELNLFYPWGISVERAIELAIQCEREAIAYDKRIMIAEETTVATAKALHLYANSHGFFGFYPYTRHEISCVLVAKENEEMQRDYSYTIASDPSGLESVSSIAKEAAERTVSRLGARSLPTMKAPVLFAAEEARSLFGHFAAAISGGNLYRKSSFLLDHLHKQVFPSFITIQEQPYLINGLGSAPFDHEGVATRANVFVENGILQNYILSTYSARKLSMRTTGNAGGVHNLLIAHGNKNLKELIASMGKGLVVTEMMGQGVNLVTGDYSKGVAGFWVENGEIQYPVHEVTVAGTLQEMFMRIAEVGNDVDVRGNIRTGSVLIEEMTIAGG